MLLLVLLAVLLLHAGVGVWARLRRASRFDPARLEAEAAEHLAIAEAVHETFGAAAPTEDEQRRRLRDGWWELEASMRRKNLSDSSIAAFKRRIFGTK